jgi:hypothetical protein
MKRFVTLLRSDLHALLDASRININGSLSARATYARFRIFS